MHKGYYERNQISDPTAKTRFFIYTSLKDNGHIINLKSVMIISTTTTTMMIMMLIMMMMVMVVVKMRKALL